jgi:uncharacterized protein YdaU (DUF1376 family)
MTAEEFGAYCRILFVMWRHGAMLKADDAELQKIAGVSPYIWKKIREKVCRPLTKIEDTYSQKRLTDTWLQVLEMRRQRADAAKARWGKKRMRAHMLPQCGSNANQNQIDITSLVDRDSDEAGMRPHATEELKKILRGRK